MTPERLKFLRELADKATPGPWETCDKAWAVWPKGQHTNDNVCDVYLSKDDTNFIAESRTAIVELLDFCSELQKQKDELQRIVDIYES